MLSCREFHDKRRNHTRIRTCSFHSGSRIRIFFHSGSRIRVKEFKYLNPKNCFYVSSLKYDQGCSSRIRIPDPQHCSSLFIYDKKNTDLSPSKVRSLPESLSVRDSISFSIRACAVRSKCCPYSWQSQGEIYSFNGGQWTHSLQNSISNISCIGLDAVIFVTL